MRSLWETQTLERLALLLQEIVERFCQSVFPTAVKGEKTAVSRTMRYVELHYAEHITLDMVAGNVYLSPSYLSSLFKKVLGFSFNEYLNTVRITEAKHRPEPRLGQCHRGLPMRSAMKARAIFPRCSSA